jgi:glycosyltransferase involved in cell wall biosynthesis
LRNVTFTGRVAPNLIAAYYAANDIYVQSPDIDNTPTSVLEAFASGLPVVSTDAGGVPRLVAHGRDGLLAAIDDHKALAGHVLRLLDDHQLAHHLAHNGHVASQAHAWPTVRDRWLQTYRAVLTAAADPQSAPSPLRVQE